jgi:hypothetical protein
MIENAQKNRKKDEIQRIEEYEKSKIVRQIPCPGNEKKWLKLVQL